MPDPNVMVRAVLSGTAGLAGALDFGQVTQVKSSSNAKVVEGKNTAFIFTAMDRTAAPFDNPDVAQAVKIAIDRPALINSAFSGAGTATTDVPLWPGNPGYPKDLGVRDQDIEQAKALLAKAGHADGIDLVLHTSTALGGMVDYATAMAQIVSPAGIRVKIQQSNPNTYWSQVDLKEPMYVTYMAARQPLQSADRFFVSDASIPESKFDDPEFDRLIGEAHATLDDDERNQLTQQALQILADKGTVSMPAAIPIQMAAAKNVEGVEIDGADYLRLGRTFISG